VQAPRLANRFRLWLSLLHVVAVVVFASASQADAKSKATRPTGTCPTTALALPATVVIGAARVALASLHQGYPGEDVRGAEVLAADRSDLAGPRGAQVRRQCGQAIAARTVVVQMLLPRLLPSASLSESVVFVSDFLNGYRTWEVAH
jgi:hypothetical protein